VHYLTDDSLRRRLLVLAGGVDVFLPSLEHLQLLFESSSDAVLDYAPQLQELGCSTVVVKAGRGGSVVFDLAARTVLSVPALAVDLVDSTGAGDGYGGGLLSGLTQGRGLSEAACWATVAASFVVEAVGASVPAHFSPELAAERFDWVADRVESFPLPFRDFRGAAK
jgi:sugar/nucleoside kinase (ribokinase family)